MPLLLFVNDFNYTSYSQIQGYTDSMKDKYELESYKITVLVIVMILLTLSAFYFAGSLKILCKP